PGVRVDADDLLALRALPALEPVGRALQLHARAALVTDLALQGRGGGAAVVGGHCCRLLSPPGRRRDAPPGWPNSAELASLRGQLPYTDLVSTCPARAPTWGEHRRCAFWIPRAVHGNHGRPSSSLLSIGHPGRLGGRPLSLPRGRDAASGPDLRCGA